MSTVRVTPANRKPTLFEALTEVANGNSEIPRRVARLIEVGTFASAEEWVRYIRRSFDSSNKKNPEFFETEVDHHRKLHFLCSLCGEGWSAKAFRVRKGSICPSCNAAGENTRSAEVYAA